MKDLKELISYFKETDKSHSKYANDLLKSFTTNLDNDTKSQINEIVVFLQNKNPKYYKNYSAESFTRAYIYNKNNGRKIGSLTDYIQYYKKRYNL